MGVGTTQFMGQLMKKFSGQAPINYSIAVVQDFGGGFTDWNCMILDDNGLVWADRHNSDNILHRMNILNGEGANLTLPSNVRGYSMAIDWVTRELYAVSNSNIRVFNLDTAALKRTNNHNYGEQAIGFGDGKQIGVRYAAFTANTTGQKIKDLDFAPYNINMQWMGNVPVWENKAYFIDGTSKRVSYHDLTSSGNTVTFLTNTVDGANSYRYSAFTDTGLLVHCAMLAFGVPVLRLYNRDFDLLLDMPYDFATYGNPRCPAWYNGKMYVLTTTGKILKIDFTY